MNCSNNDNSSQALLGDFNPFNLSTWSKQQKSLISKDYLQSARNFYYTQPTGPPSWMKWINDGENGAVQKALAKISPTIQESNYSFYQQLTHNDGDNAGLSKVLQDGITLTVKSNLTQAWRGSLSVFIKGKIKLS